jgi:transforming growth factor-beta-induced protein
MFKRMIVVVLLLMLAVVPFSAAQAQGGNTILDIALAVNAQTGEFSTLIAAVVYGQLDDVLGGEGQFTVFAPTDAAFAKLGLNASNITSVPKKELRRIVRYHIARGERFSPAVLNSKRIRMLTGNFVKITVNSDGAFVNQAELLAPDLIDIDASNGVIHVIDSVLIPPTNN